jgi:hypothetical protein
MGTEVEAGGYVVDPALLNWVAHLMLKHLKSIKSKPNGVAVTQTYLNHLLNSYLPASSPQIVPGTGENWKGPNCRGGEMLRFVEVEP